METDTTIPIPKLSGSDQGGRANRTSYPGVARVSVDNGIVVFHNSFRLPNPKNSLQQRLSNDCSSVGKAFPANDHDEITRYVEELARSNRYKAFLKNDEAGGYRLWAECVKNSTGIVLREPHLSNVCLYGVPRNITGNQFYGGDAIDCLEKGEEKNDAMAMAKLSLDYFAIRGTGFTRSFFLPGRTKYSDESVDDKGAYFLYGNPGEHFVANLCFVSAKWAFKLPTLFNSSNADRILARLNRFLPEITWNLVSSGELKAAVFLAGSFGSDFSRESRESCLRHLDTVWKTPLALRVKKHKS